MEIWTDAQKTYLKVKKQKYKTSDGVHNYESILNYIDLNDIAKLYKLFIKNTITLTNDNLFCSGYIGKDFYINYQAESKTNDVREKSPNPDFKKFSIDKDTLKSLILDKGIYLPVVLANIDGKLAAVECLHSAYPSCGLRELFVENLIDNRQIFYIVRDNNQFAVNITLDVPIKLYNEVIQFLNLEVIASDANNVTLKILNKRDAWLIYKCIHKEISCLTGRKWKELHANNIFPDPRINREV